ncbi:MAG: putative bifunctional diguanylate cyclase/phosphodiesterase [Sphingobium sp.]
MPSASWIGKDFVPDGQTARPPKAGGNATSPWLAALPYPASLVRLCGDAIGFDEWNALFARHFPVLIDDTFLGDPQWRVDFWAELTAFAHSRQITSRFEIERTGPLGIEAFACSLAWVKGDGPGGDRILVSAVDRTADRRIEESLRRELISDTLTSLPNRVGFGEAVEMLLERNDLPKGTRVAVLIVDLMRFSRINEALGTMAGDELILAVAARFKGAVGNMVTLARIGGNEFGICHPAPNGIKDVKAVVARVRDAVANPIRLANLEISLNLAIGCSLAPIEEAETDELIRQAQAAARVAKRSDRLEIFRPGELGVVRQRFLLESRLRDALDAGALHLQYQPIIELSSQQVTGFEALSRWEDPDLGTVSPHDFIPVAEESGLVVKLGRWALHQAMRQLTVWDEAFGGTVPLKMNVNLSPIQMARDDVLDMIRKSLARHNVDGRRLMIELTESAIVTDPESCRLLLESLKKQNIAIAMDDFGTGFSNMASLQSLPIDLLKIDRSFVSGMQTDQDKLAIIRAILSLARALGMSTTAEGIENATEAEMLRDMGCTYGQGYYFARPMMADKAYDYWLSRRKADT